MREGARPQPRDHQRERLAASAWATRWARTGCRIMVDPDPRHEEARQDPGPGHPLRRRRGVHGNAPSKML
ncbi:MAG: hypothetical protein MZU91_13565 [Desulfosudis oleivorans]|nr:hypothetical protein [Desulfosudis oleivorans]